MKRIQGQGDTTEWKQRGLGSAFYVGLKVAALKLAKQPFYHFDLNAGSGYNFEAKCIGSPLAFASAVVEADHNQVHAHFVDCDQDKLEHLQTLMTLPGCAYHCTDNKEFVSRIPELVKYDRYAVGSILCDPNGADIPFEELNTILAEYRRLDLIVNWNSTIYKRCNNSPKHKNYPKLQELPELFSKQHCLIRRPSPSDPHGFTLFIGRNFNTGDHVRLGFHKLTDDCGAQIAYRLDTTREQRKDAFFGAQLQLSF